MAVERNNYASFKEYPGPIKRQGPFNIDTSAMYTSRAAALEYAKTNPAAYDGQILTVTETNADGSTALYYFGIKNAVVTKADGTTSIEPQLMQIMTLLDSENLLHKVGAVKYCGTLELIQEGSEQEENIVHFSFDEVTSSLGLVPTAGDMYNLHFASSIEPQTAHVHTVLDSFNEVSEGEDWDPTGDRIEIDSFVEEEVNGETRYGIVLKLGTKMQGAFPPYLESCWNYISYNTNDNVGEGLLLFYDTFEYGYSVVNDQVVGKLTLLFIDAQEAVEKLDNWALTHKLVPEGATSLRADPSAKTAWTKLKEDYESQNVKAMALAFAQLLRNGDNIIYNGRFWDVVSGMVDLTPYATREELTASLSNSTSIYRQE